MPKNICLLAVRVTGAGIQRKYETQCTRKSGYRTPTSKAFSVSGKTNIHTYHPAPNIGIPDVASSNKAEN